MRLMNENKLSELANFIKQYARDNNGKSPSLGEITNMMETSKSTAYRYVMELDKRGIISYSGKNTLASSLQQKMQCEYRKVPIAGQIICGSPDEQEEHISEYLAIPEEWVDGECYLLRAYGDSMVDIGIFEDDLILVKKTSEATNGQVVVALTENGNTLKRLFWEENGQPRLHAENKSYDVKDIDIYPKEMTIQGIALKVIRNIC